jgi:hypothetical protein
MEEVLFDPLSERILDSLGKVYKKKIFSDIANGLLTTCSIIITGTTLFSAVQFLFQFDNQGRTALFVLLILTFIITVARYAVPNLIKYFRSPSFSDLREISLSVGERFPELKDRLRNAIELLADRSSPDAHYSKELAQKYIEQIFNKASHLDIASALDYKIDKRTKYFATVSFVLALILFSVLPNQMFSSLKEIINFTKEMPKPYVIEVLPGDAQLSRGDTLNIRVKLSSPTGKTLPSHIKISERYENERDFEIHELNQGRLADLSTGYAFSAMKPQAELFTFQLPNIRNNLEYFVTAGSQRTRNYEVRVRELPVVQNFHVILAYPSYTKKGVEILPDNVGDFSALVGTRAEFTLQSNKELKAAWLLIDDSTGAHQNLRTSGKTANGYLLIRHMMKYSIYLLDYDSLQNRDPITYSIQAITDAYPTCEITYPGKDIDLSRDMQLPLQIKIDDDYGFTKLLLEYKLLSSKFVHPDENYRSLEIPLPNTGAGEQDISYTWDLTPLDLVPEDIVSYHVKVFDNDLVNGPKAATSSEYTIRLPSLNEVFAETDSQHSDLISKTENALGNSDDLRQEIEKISNEMKAMTQQMTWEQQKKMQTTLQRYEDLQRQVDSLKNQIESMTQKMLENKILSPQTLEKYLELQKAIQEINSPEFQNALKKLEEAIQSLNPSQVRQALQNFHINEEQFRQSIERTLSLIKRVEIEQKFDELQKRVEQMLEQQQRIQKSTAESDSTLPATRQRLSEEQKEIQKELSEAKEAMSDLKKRMDEFSNEMPIKKMEQTQRQLEQANLEQKIQISSQRLSQGLFSEAQNLQRQVSSELKNFQASLSQTQKEMLQNQSRETINAMRKAEENLLEISKKQEELRNQSSRLMPNSAETRQLAERQNELMQELNYTAQQMMQLSNKSFAVTPQMGRQMGRAYAQMQQALNNLQQRENPSTTVESQSEAMGAMNEAVMSIQSTLQSMMNGQGGGGFMSLTQQLQQLTGQQEGLNALTQKLSENGSLTMEQQAELSRLAAQQELIHKSLEQLAREAQQSEGTGSQERFLGNLDQIANDMKQVVKDLQNNSEIKPETIQRQQKILSRMLDATRSINKQDYSNKRVGKPGQNIVGKNPADLNLSNSNSEQYNKLLKLIKQNFPPEYQKVILRYYQLLKKTPE